MSELPRATVYTDWSDERLRFFLPKETRILGESPVDAIGMRRVLIQGRLPPTDEKLPSYRLMVEVNRPTTAPQVILWGKWLDMAWQDISTERWEIGTWPSMEALRARFDQIDRAL